MATAPLIGNIGNTGSFGTASLAPPTTPPSSATPVNAGPAGTVFVRDSFEFQDPVTPPHGEIVGQSLRQQGFKGPILKHQQPQFSNSGQKLALDSSVKLSTDQLTKADALRTLTDQVRGSISGMMDSQSNYLNELKQKGAKNSVVNLSWGDSKADETLRLYQNAMNPPGNPFATFTTPSRTLDNFATAFDLDASKLRSFDPKIAGPERQKLQQALADHVSNVSDNDPTVKASKSNWGTAVKDFESNNNSVVIAAGNEGQHKNFLQQQNPGYPLKLDSDFEQSYLENDAVTSVGATRWFRKDGELTEHKAKYSTNSNGIDIYASGSIGLKNKQEAQYYGTSFSAPRVAGVMAEIHRKNPQMSSEQVEGLMKQKFSHELTDGAGELPVLDFGKSYNFLQNQTY